MHRYPTLAPQMTGTISGAATPSRKRPRDTEGVGGPAYNDTGNNIPNDGIALPSSQ